MADDDISVEGTDHLNEHGEPDDNSDLIITGEANSTCSPKGNKTNDDLRKTGNKQSKTKKGKGLFSYFRRGDSGENSSTWGKQTDLKVNRREQVNKHFCIYDGCHKMITRGNKWSRKRHADSCHKSRTTTPPNYYP